ncbi:MAG: dienelactone hydrolase family protein [Acidobacteria bacterium]|nr:dienelactone hydrolase family protein [Acidobacteriota bacterium]
MMRSIYSRMAAICLVLLMAPSMASAQADRFELGQHLRACESAWDSQPDMAARKRAVEHLKQSVTLFFSLKLSEAGRELDQARFALKSSTPASGEAQWAESIYVRPDSRFIDSSLLELPFSVMQMYQVSDGKPGKASIRLSLILNGKTTVKPQSFEISTIPTTGVIKTGKLKDGDYALRAEVVSGKIVLSSSEQVISISSNLTSRIEKIKTALESMNTKESSTDIETAKNLLGTLTALSQKQSLETNYNANRILNDAEALIKAVNENREFFDNRRIGQFWLSLKIGSGSVPVRMMIPQTAGKGTPLPLVIAMHGAGGSENLFFDGYGRGVISMLSESRGWLLVAPRGSSGFTPGRAAEIIDAVNRLYPVDRKKVFIVGHSMGASQAVATVQQTPEIFAAVAALGGGGNVKKESKIQDVPFYIGVGSDDFALPNARKLESGLRDSGVKSVRMREYDGVEHLVIVQEALPEVFRFFDEIITGLRNTSK